MIFNYHGLPPFFLLYLRQHIPEYLVVMLHAVVEVYANHLGCQMVYLFLKCLGLRDLLLKLGELLGELHALGAGRAEDAPLQIG